MFPFGLGGLVVIFFFLIWVWNSLYIIKEWERGVVLRLGRLVPEAKTAGVNIVIWPIETLYRISLRLETLDVPPQDIITRDNVSVKVNAVCYFRVVDANLALSQVQNYQYATSQLAQTTLRSVVGQFELDEILSQRDKVNAKLQIILDQDTEPWGIKVSKVEVKQVDIPEQMQRAIAKQAEAERERRAKIIHAEGEFEASQKLADAAKVLETQPTAIQLRYLQTLTEIGVEKNTTIVFPLPIDIINNWMKSIGGVDAVSMGSSSKRSASDRVLESKHVIGLFLLMLVFSGIFFTLGYVMGRNQYDGQVRASSTSSSAEPIFRKTEAAAQSSSSARKAPAALPSSDADPATTNNSDWEFTSNNKPSRPEPRLEASPKNISPQPVAKPVDPKPTAPAPQQTPAPTAKNGKNSLNAPLIPSGAIVLQVAALVKQDDALVIAGNLQKKHFAAYVQTPQKDKFYRVQVGPFKDKKAAEAAKKGLENEGFKAFYAIH